MNRKANEMNKQQTKVFIRFDEDKPFIEIDDLLERKEKRTDACAMAAVKKGSK